MSRAEPAAKAARVSSLLRLALIAALLLSGVAATPASVVEPGPSGKLLLHRGDAGNRALYEVDADGTGLRRLTRAIAGAWAPNGRDLAVLRPHADVLKIFVGRLRDGEWRFRLLLPSSRRHELGPVWSPDGRRLAFARSRGRVPAGMRGINLATHPTDIWTVGRDGRGLRRLAGGTGRSVRSFPISTRPGRRTEAQSHSRATEPAVRRRRTSSRSTAAERRS